ncbi:matrixin family metalloprotease [uncultured Aquimarina sp.]|uniref:matrixin family metalloprotease n=1 Tax=uncultured Aquimarina sp. TaxID=575652 RepID=UPI002602FFD8|nr:matrixin family metalloprotease [uncultured Aquimarina sp.]
MRYLLFLFLLFLLPSCTVEDDYVPTSIEPIFMDNPSAKLLVDIIYVVPSKNHNQSKYAIDETRFMDFINGCFFNRHNIGFEMGESRVLINSELYDLKDNRDQESSVFNTETQDSYRQDRMNIYIIPRTNTVAIAGIGLKQRALITDEFLFTTTAPHEIGHALGLSHKEVEGNIMCRVKPYLRKEFDSDQVDTMYNKILSIN